MKKMKFNRFAARSVKAGLVVAALVVASGAFACTVTNWEIDGGAVTAGVEAGGPESSTPVDIPRYSGVCAMRTPANPAQAEYVQNGSPNGLDRIRARFYVFASNGSDAVVYVGFDETSNPVFSVTLDQSEPEVDFTALGTTVSAPYNPDKWNSIEIDWNAGAGVVELIVNGSSDIQSPGVSSETVDFVRLGNLTPVADQMLFDAYESRRTTAIGRLIVADANGDGTVNSQDIAIMVNELLDTSFAKGQVDCNEDGAVNSQDLACIVNVLLN